MGMISCKNAGSGLSPVLGLLGSSNESSDPAAMKYLEYMYNDENGKRLNDQAMSGMPTDDDFKAEIKEFMSVPFIESLGQSTENAESANWWEIFDINADDVAAYLVTESGRRAMENYMSADGAEEARIVSGLLTGGSYSTIIEEIGNSITVFKRTMSLLNDMPAFLTWKNIMMAGLWVFGQFNDINQQLDAIQSSIEEGFEQTLYQLDSIEEFLMNQPLVEAKNTVNAKIKSFVNLDGYDDLYRSSVVKEYFTTEHQILFEQAYNSALVITEELNSRPASTEYKSVPGNMLYSHMVFMRQMSELRLAYAPIFYSGQALLRFRANWAKSDLVWLKEIKDAFLSDPNPDADADYFNQVCALLVSWEIVLRSHIELYNGMNVGEVDLEDAKNINDTYAFATFGDLNDIDGNGTCGEPLATSIGAAIMSLFNYGDSLENVFDSGTSGDLAAGKYLRVVHDDKNLVSGLGLVPVAKKLTGISEISVAPGKNQFFVDPALGRMVLPRPSYWSKMEDHDGVVNPMIKEEDPVWLPTEYGSGSKFVSEGKWNSCYYTDTSSWGNRSNVLKPFGENYTSMSSGTVSLWLKLGKGTIYRNCIATQSTSVELLYNEAYIYVPSLEEPVMAYADLSTKFHHVYIVWDVNGLDQSNATIKVYVDGILAVETEQRWESGEFYQEFYAWGFASGMYVDNIKIWKHVVSLDPLWDLNSGAGWEDSLHSVYGRDSGYRPVLSGAGNGVGYYFMK